jgi:hypothetical protein
MKPSESDIGSLADYLTVTEAKEFLLQSEEYDWLVRHMKMSMVMEIRNDKRVSLVRKSLLDNLPKAPFNRPYCRELSITLSWDPQNYMIEQFDSVVNLGATVVLVGTMSEAYATTCREYLAKMWPEFGIAILEAIQQTVQSNTEFFRGYIKDVTLELRLSNNHTQIRSTGHAVHLSEIFEVVVFIGTVCRTSECESSISSLEPVISVQNQSGDSDLHFEIDFAELTIDEATSTTAASSC